MKISTVKEMIDFLKTMPEYASIAIEVPDDDGGAEYANIDAEKGDDYPDEKLALVILKF